MIDDIRWRVETLEQLHGDQPAVMAILARISDSLYELELEIQRVPSTEQKVIDKLRLNERTLVFSEITISTDAKGKEYEVIRVGGEYESRSIDSVSQYATFVEALPAGTTVSVDIENCRVGIGPERDASNEEADLIDANRDILEDAFGIVAYSKDSFLESTPEKKEPHSAGPNGPQMR